MADPRPNSELDAELMFRIMQMRTARMPFRTIAATLGISTTKAHNLNQQAIAATITEAGEEIKAMELERLDQLYRLAMKKAATGDTQAILACLKIAESSRRMLGVDAPARTESTVTVEEPADAELRELLQHQRAANKAEVSRVDGN